MHLYMHLYIHTYMQMCSHPQFVVSVLLSKCISAFTNYVNPCFFAGRVPSTTALRQRYSSLPAARPGLTLIYIYIRMYTHIYIYVYIIDCFIKYLYFSTHVNLFRCCRSCPISNRPPPAVFFTTCCSPRPNSCRVWEGKSRRCYWVRASLRRRCTC